MKSPENSTENTALEDSENRKGNRTVLKAGAGTGKTYRLSLEFIGNLIKNVSYRDIIVLTFTKKATAEIKERIYDFLYRIAFEDEKGFELAESLKNIFGFNDSDIDRKKLRDIYFEMIKNKEEIRIYTIDGFTNKIFKTAIAPSLGIYSYETLDEDEETFYGDIFLKVLENEEYLKKFQFVIEEKGEKKNINKYTDFIRNIIQIQKSYLLAGDYKNNESVRPDYSFLNYIEEIFYKIENIAEIKNSGQRKKPQQIKLPVDYLNKDFKNIYSDFKNIDIQISKDIDENRREKIEILTREALLFFGKVPENSPSIWNGNKVKGGNVVHILEELKDTKEVFLKSFSKYIYAEKILPLHSQIKELARELYKLAEKTKIASKKFTHEDITSYTYKFIFDEKLKFIKDGKVTEEFLDLIGGKIKTVMIDEFQDTSVLQWKILKLLISDAENVICAGDEKQSIYSWRGGEKGLFEKLEGIIDGKTEVLNKSYRSYRQVIENVNTIYKGYRNDWFYNVAEYRNDEEYRKGFFSYEIKAVEKNKNNDEVDRGYDKIVHMIKEGKIKNLGKTCIICRKNSHLNEIAEKLNEAGIPYTLSSNASILEHKAVKPLYKLIKYLLFNNTSYLLEFMRSDLIGCLNSHVKYILENKDEIEKYINGKGIASNTDTEYFPQFAGLGEDSEKMSEYREIDNLERNGLSFTDILFKIKKLKKLSKNLNSVYSKENFSKEIIESFEVIKYYSTKSDIKNVFNFFYILKGYSSLFEFITFMEEKKDKITQKSSGDIDAVNLMTTHKSKGLEFDTVFYYKRDSDKDMDKDNEVISYLNYDEHFNEVDNFLVLWSKYKHIFIDGYYYNLKEELKRKKEIEEINGDYVALTRAKKNLILLLDVIVKDGKYKSELASKLVEKYNGEETYSVGEIIESAENINIRPSEEKDYEGHAKRCGETECAGKTEDNGLNIPDKIIPYFSDAAAKIEKDGFKTDLEHELKRKKGLAMHYYFEHILNNPDEERKTAKSAILFKYGNLIGKTALNELIGRMERFILKNKGIYDRKYKVYNEFEIYDEDGKRKVIDRINIDEEKKEIHIYDYKTGYEPLENEKYVEQIENYKTILEKKLDSKYTVYAHILEVV